MMHKYTEDQAAFIKINITGRPLKELTQMFNSHFELNVKPSQLKSYLTNHKLRSGLKKIQIIKTHKYTKAQTDFIKDNIAGRTIKELTQLFNTHFELQLECSQIKSHVANHGLISGIKKQPLKKHIFTKDQVDFLVSIVPGHSYKELIELFYEKFGVHLSFNQIKCFIGNRKLNTGRKGYFTKGNIPFNKGKKGLTMGGIDTQFKKGHLPHNHQPVGTERVRTPHPDRPTKDDYIDVKIAEPNKWRGKHLLVWEAYNGRPVPKGYAVIFGDGNNRNFDPNNLILVSRKQLVVLNKKKLIQSDADLTRTSVIIADLALKISERKHNYKENT